MSIKDMRKEHGLTQEQAAEALGIKQSYYSRIERGQANPTFRQFRGIAKLYNAKVDALVRAFVEAGDTIKAGSSSKGADPGLFRGLILSLFPARSPLALSRPAHLTRLSVTVAA